MTPKELKSLTESIRKVALNESTPNHQRNHETIVDSITNSNSDLEAKPLTDFQKEFYKKGTNIVAKDGDDSHGVVIHHDEKGNHGWVYDTPSQSGPEPSGSGKPADILKDPGLHKAIKTIKKHGEYVRGLSKNDLTPEGK